MVFDAIVSGIGVGFLISLLLGPVFFTLLYTSIHKGFKAGAFFASGIVAADAILFLLAYFSLTQFSDIGSLHAIMALLGGIILVLYGGRLWLKKCVRIKLIKEDHTHASLFGFAAKGFLINGMNPFVFMYWLGIVGGIGIKHDFNPEYLLVFFGACMVTIFLFDLAKSHLSCKLQNLMKMRFFFYVNKFSAGLLIVFGVYLLWNAVSEGILDGIALF